LAIVKTSDDPTIETYVNLKKRYGSDIGVEVEIYDIEQNQAEKVIKQLNSDLATDAIIIQLPLADSTQTDVLLSAVEPKKDVDGLNPASSYESATANAILWLLAGYNVNLAGKSIVVVGQGRLVGRPVADALESSGLHVVRVDESTKNLQAEVEAAEVIISATGQPELIKNAWIQSGTVVVDAGVAGEKGKLVGDIEQTALLRDDLTITPAKGGLGPLTVCSLFENVLKTAEFID